MNGMHQTRYFRYRCVASLRRPKGSTCPFVVPIQHVDTPVLAPVAAIITGLVSRDPQVGLAIQSAWRVLQAPTLELAAETMTQLRRDEALAVRLRQRLTKATELFADGDIDKARYNDMCAKTTKDLTVDEASIQLLRQVETPTPYRRWMKWCAR
jgi:hypothetical protein